MNWVDYTILVVIGISVLISVWRGFTREVFSLAGWIASLWVALTYSDRLHVLLQNDIETPSVRMAVAFSILFIVTLLIATLCTYLAVQLIKKTGLSGTDRMIGIIFGVGRGCVVVAVLVIVGGMTPVPQDPWWQQSQLLHYFQEMALWGRQFLPPDIATTINYSQ